MKKFFPIILGILTLISFFLNIAAGDQKKADTFVHQLNVMNKFGGLDVPVEQSFDNPVDIDVSEDGNIYILDSNDNNIKIFQNNGTFVKTIGREGSGPGDLRRPWIFQIIGSRIFIADANNRRVQILNVDGKYEAGYKAPLSFGKSAAFDAQGNLYLITQGLRSPNLISVYDNQGNLSKEFGVLESESFDFYDFTLIKEQIKKGQIPDSMKNDLLLIVDKNSDLFAVHNSLNKLKKFSNKGDLLFIAEIEAEEYEDIYREFQDKNKELENKPNIYYPLRYVNGLAVNREGDLYVLLNVPSRMIVYVFAGDGIFKGKMLGVEDSIYRIAISDRGDLYALSQDTHCIYQFELDHVKK